VPPSASGLGVQLPPRRRPILPRPRADCSSSCVARREVARAAAAARGRVPCGVFRGWCRLLRVAYSTEVRASGLSFQLQVEVMRNGVAILGAAAAAALIAGAAGFVAGYRLGSADPVAGVAGAPAGGVAEGAGEEQPDRFDDLAREFLPDLIEASQIEDYTVRREVTDFWKSQEELEEYQQTRIAELWEERAEVLGDPNASSNDTRRAADRLAELMSQASPAMLEPWLADLMRVRLDGALELSATFGRNAQNLLNFINQD